LARNLSPAARRAIFASQTGEAVILLLTLDHASFADPIRVCSAGEDITSGGLLYQWFPFELTLPPEDDEKAATVKLRIGNADRRVVEAARSVTGAPISVSFSLILDSSPDVVEAGPFEFSLRDVTYDAVAVEGTLRYEDVLSEPYPAGTMNPSDFPGLF
jgi:hypothetical protein